jgi:hypothetical protein
MLNAVNINNLSCSDLEILTSIGYPKFLNLRKLLKIIFSKKVIIFSYNLKLWLPNARKIIFLMQQFKNDSIKYLKGIRNFGKKILFESDLFFWNEIDNKISNAAKINFGSCVDLEL